MPKTASFIATDPEQLTELVSDAVGIKTLFETSGAEQFRTTLTVGVGHQLRIMNSTSESDVFAHIPQSEEAISFIFLDNGYLSHDRTKSEVIDSGRIAVLDHRKTDVMRYYGKSSITAAVVDISTLKSYYFKVVGKECDFKMEKELSLDRSQNASASFVQAIKLTSLFISNAAEGDIPDFAVRRLEEAALASILLQMESAGWSDRGSPDLLMPRHLREAIDLIQGSDRPLLVSELAAEIGVSARTLQAGFRSTLGVGPLEHLKLHRLGKVREGLRAKGSSELKALCRHWGFTNYTRFRREYIECYGKDDWVRHTGRT